MFYLRAKTLNKDAMLLIDRSCLRRKKLDCATIFSGSSHKRSKKIRNAWLISMNLEERQRMNLSFKCLNMFCLGETSLSYSIHHMGPKAKLPNFLSSLFSTTKMTGDQIQTPAEIGGTAGSGSLKLEVKSRCSFGWLFLGPDFHEHPVFWGGSVTRLPLFTRQVAIGWLLFF